MGAGEVHGRDASEIREGYVGVSTFAMRYYSHRDCSGDVKAGR
jgi:hypothetical protein